MDPFVVIDIKGVITDMNEHLAQITGVSRENLLGTFIYSYFSKPEDAKKAFAELMEKGFLLNSSLVIKDHKLTQVLLNGSNFFKNGTTEVLGAVLVIRDITEQIRIEKELIRAKEVAELATEVADMAKITAENSKNIAEDAVKAKQLFLSNMSHEIRTPMNAIIGFTKVMMKTNLTANQKVYLSAIKVSGDSLIVLINDILDLAKVDAGKMTFESVPFKLEAATLTMLKLFEIKILEKNILLVKKYDPRIPKVLLGDPVRLHQIIINLLSNAIKFTNAGSITFSANMIFEDEERVTIDFTLADTGIGVSEEKLATIFEKFQQASSSTARLFGGTGLGLAIVKQLVEQQGGSVHIKSKLGVGTTLGFTLDFLKTNADADEEERTFDLSISKEAKVKLKVLVVEDIELNQLLMKTILEDFGFEQEVAANGKIAIEMMEKNAYDIILMDLQMPVMNGFETTNHIRNVMHSSVPIIALTADVTTADVAKCEAAGMNDYLAKPVNEDLLLKKITALISPSFQKEILLQEIHTPVVAARFTDLSYLKSRTKSNDKLMLEMINAYLIQTPPLISALKMSLIGRDWSLMHATVHKIIPSFSIMGISEEFELTAKKIQNYANAQIEFDSIFEMVIQIETVCLQACKELQLEVDEINQKNSK